MSSLGHSNTSLVTNFPKSIRKRFLSYLCFNGEVSNGCKILQVIMKPCHFIFSPKLGVNTIIPLEIKIK